MNYKKRNAIGFISFFLIILFMLNFKFLSDTVNNKILSIRFTGLKGDKVFFSELDDKELTKGELVEYIMKNFENFGYEKLKNLNFSVYTRDIDGEDNFVEKFKIPVVDNFNDSLYENLSIIPINEELLFKFVLNFKDKDYLSRIFSIKIVDDLYKKEKKIILNLDKFTNKGTTSFVSVPKYLNLNNNSKINIEAKYNNLTITGLNATYDEENNVIKINNLVPLKLYSNIKIVTKNPDGIEITININNLRMDSENELQDYLSKIYLNSFNRYPAENEYFNYLVKLSNHEIAINDFLDTIIMNNEFDIINDTPKKIIDSIYFLVNKKSISSRLSTLILDEFNNMLLDIKLVGEAKLKILNKFLYSDESLEYIKIQLNLMIK